MYSSVCPGPERPTASVLVTADGPSKCGKTTIIGRIVSEADHRTRYGLRYIRYAEGVPGLPVSSAADAAVLGGLLKCLSFNQIVGISAGNSYRAATAYVQTLEERRRPKARFEARDAANIRDLLATKGIYERLQHDPAIDARVGSVARMPGAHAVCGALFCDEVVAAYQAGGGGNLVVADARDPVGHLVRNDRLGAGEGLVQPRSIMPFYIDTPVEDSAQWMVASKGGELDDWITYIDGRRREDEDREELPVTRPATLISGYGLWEQQFYDPAPDEAIALPYHFRNGEHMKPENIDWFAGHLALAAQNHRHQLQHLQPVA